MSFAAIVLAAGLSRRMGGPNKLLMAHRGKPLIAWAVAAACASRAQRVVLVTGRDGDAVALAAGQHAKLVRAHNLRPTDGLSASLKLGLAQTGEADAVAVLLGDMPGVEATLLDLLFEAWRADAYAAVPVFQGEAGNPVILGRAAMADCAALEGDRGARKLIDAHAAKVLRVPVSTRAILADFDAPADFGR